LTIVVHTSAKTGAQTHEAMHKIAGKHGLASQGKPLTFNDTATHYYDVSDNAKAEKAVADFLKVDGVSAAYVKPDGAPPKM